jgi:hypothetical protein
MCHEVMSASADWTCMAAAMGQQEQCQLCYWMERPACSAPRLPPLALQARQLLPQRQRPGAMPRAALLQGRCCSAQQVPLAQRLPTGH